MKFYRVLDHTVDHGYKTAVKTFLEVWHLVKETPKGYWISQYPNNQDWEWARAERKWVSKTSVKRYAYPSIPEALNSWRKRKERQLAHCEWNLRRAQALMTLAKTDDPTIELVVVDPIEVTL